MQFLGFAKRSLTSLLGIVLVPPMVALFSCFVLFSLLVVVFVVTPMVTLFYYCFILVGAPFVPFQQFRLWRLFGL
jgi:hypothetical protein